MLKFLRGLPTVRCAVAGALLLAACSAWANRQGRPDSIDVSCAANAGCHAPAGGYDYAVAVSLPTTRLTSAEPTALAVSLTVTNNDPANPAHGFGWNIEAPGAVLAPVAGDSSQRLDGGELVQSDRLSADGDGGATLGLADVFTDFLDTTDRIGLAGGLELGADAGEASFIAANTGGLGGNATDTALVITDGGGNVTEVLALIQNVVVGDLSGADVVLLP